MFILGLAGCAFSLALEAGIVATYVTPEKLVHPNQAALGVAVGALQVTPLLSVDLPGANLCYAVI